MEAGFRAKGAKFGAPGVDVGAIFKIRVLCNRAKFIVSEKNSRKHWGRVYNFSEEYAPLGMAASVKATNSLSPNINGNHY